MNNKIIIQGTTPDGKKFRPSDWAERVSGNLITIKNHRLYYSPLIRPSYRDGIKCVVIDHELKESNPDLFNYIIQFATENNLKFCNDEEIGEET